ncbi:MAG: hypothetical protein WBG50_26110 [Desulfomonilaceae bacterium]
MKNSDTVPCPHCGGEMKRTAKACPHCGSDESTGWSDTTYLDDILPDDDNSYEEIREREFGEPSRKRPNRKTWIYITAIILLILAALVFIKIVF